ncbi:unnamed protein product [Linum tenue]|uniref:Uncharacterized protein n=1 Tax=Linum tenue TaxID=586396 RepID=A0AAV0KID1_9ROSI|nr:unnamed protein product [Linum tenue]
MSPSSSSHDIVLTSSPEGPITAYNASTGASLPASPAPAPLAAALALVQNTYIAASHISSSSTRRRPPLQLVVIHRPPPLPLPEPLPLSPLPPTAHASSPAASRATFIRFLSPPVT